MNKFSLIFTIVLCVVLIVMQTVFLLIPATFQFFYTVLRPLSFIAFGSVVFAVMGFDVRSKPGAYTVNIIGLASVLLFGMIVLSLAFILDIVINPMAPDGEVILRNLWNHGVVIFIGAYLRYKLINGVDKLSQSSVFVVLTLVLAYVHMGGVRMLGTADVVAVEVVFESIFRPLIISIAASYFAIKGSFAAVALVNIVYSMSPYLLPFLPNISSLTFSLIIGGTLFISILVCHFITSERARIIRVREKRVARYAKKPVLTWAATVAALALVLAFFLNVFPAYPVVVLTDSMEPALRRGSLIFIERIPQGEAYERVGEGEIIHFLSNDGVPYVHRVVGHWYNHHDERHYITQGDANEAEDLHPVPSLAVQGVVRATLPFFGYPYIFFQTVQGAFR